MPLLTPYPSGRIPARVARLASDAASTRNRRLDLDVSPEDRAAFDRLPRRPFAPWIRVTDRTSGVVLEVTTAPCWLDCYCAAVARVPAAQPAALALTGA